jgi:hypothetical protein
MKGGRGAAGESEGDAKMKLGEDHPNTLTSMNNLAFTWRSLG